MKILVVQESDWENNGPHQNHHLMERMTQRGHDVRVIDYKIRWFEKKDSRLLSKRNERTVDPKVIDGSRIFVITPPLIKLPIFDYLSSLYYQNREVSKQIKIFKPDIVVCLGILNVCLATVKSQFKSIPVVNFTIDANHRLVPEKPFQNIAKIIESYNIRKADMVISINEGLRDYTIRMGSSLEKTEVISGGVDTNLYNQIKGDDIRKKYGVLENDLLLFFMGWFYPFSGLQETIIQIAKNPDDRIKLLLVGKGDAKAELDILIANFNLQHKVFIKDWVPFNQIPKYIAAADFCLLTAHKNHIMNDIVPIKMYEYLASGKPVIATRLNGLLKEFGIDGGVFFIDNPESSIDAVDYILNNDLYETISENALNFAIKCDWSELVNKFEMKLVGLIKQKPIFDTRASKC